MSYRPYPIPSRIERVLKEHARILLPVDLQYVLSSLTMQDKLLDVISNFLASCVECRGGDFCPRCDSLIGMRDAALGPKLVNKNAAPKKQKPVAPEYDEENELDETEAA